MYFATSLLHICSRHTKIKKERKKVKIKKPTTNKKVKTTTNREGGFHPPNYYKLL